MSDSVSLYVELLKKCVGNSIYDDDLDMMRGQTAVDEQTGKYVVLDGEIAKPEEKYLGHIWPSRAHTMIGVPRLDNIQHCVEEVLRAGVAGDLIETGVWRGGASIFMRGVLKAHGVTDRQVWVADSFEGLPPPDHARYPKEGPSVFHMHEALAVSLDEVRTNFERYGLLDEQVRFLKGWFRDSLPTAPIEKLAVMRLDGDMYESTMDALVWLYPKLSPGGFVIVDDYNAVATCNEAVQDFRKERGITAELLLIPGAGAFWRK
jgi:O-methyltransferase